MNEKQWIVLTHLSGLGMYIFPFGNIVIPMIIWVSKKQEFPSIDEHGKAVLNFQISITIWLIIAAIFVFLLIGLPVLIVLGILHIVFVIIGTLKADQGIVYNYPLTIDFIR